MFSRLLWCSLRVQERLADIQQIFLPVRSSFVHLTEGPAQIFPGCVPDRSREVFGSIDRDRREYQLGFSIVWKDGEVEFGSEIDQQVHTMWPCGRLDEQSVYHRKCVFVNLRKL